MRYRFLIFLVFSTAMLIPGACGYHFGPTSGESETVVVKILANETREPLLEKDLTNFLISELERSPFFVPIESNNPSQLSLEGSVTRYSTTAVAYDELDTIVRYLVQISASMTLREEPSGRVVWKGTVHADEEHLADTDKAVQAQLEVQAKVRALSRLAEEITQQLSQRI